ncbi:MAG: macro domain-containing protein [Chloroflexia bacterium]|nr:macro domain-containing protein [Chloroflexia bacterium]
MSNSSQTNRVTAAPEVEADGGVRFGRTLLRAVAGEVLDVEADAIVCPANRRGVMGVGVAGQVRIAGGVEIEREAMAGAPLAIGTAIATSSGKLAERGVTLIIHAVVADALGAPTRPDIVRQATGEALRLADRHRARSLALPPLGVGLGPGRLTTEAVAELMIEEILAYLRRFTSRLELIVLVARAEEEAAKLRRLLLDARHYWLGSRP